MNLYSQWCKKHANSKQLALQQLSPFHWLCVFAWLYSILLLLLQDQMLPMLPLAGIQPLQRAWPPEFSERLHFVACQMCTWSCWAGFKCMTCCHSASSSWLPHSPNWQRRLKHVSMTKQKGDYRSFPWLSEGYWRTFGLLHCVWCSTPKIPKSLWDSLSLNV